jgi:hypothetical protein
MVEWQLDEAAEMGHANRAGANGALEIAYDMPAEASEGIGDVE